MKREPFYVLFFRRKFQLVTDLRGEIMSTAMEEELVELIGTVSNRVKKNTA